MFVSHNHVCDNDVYDYVTGVPAITFAMHMYRDYHSRSGHVDLSRALHTYEWLRYHYTHYYIPCSGARAPRRRTYHHRKRAIF